MKKNWIIPIVFGGIGLLFLVITFFIITSEEKFVENAKMVEGKVINLEYHSSKNGGAYHPVVEYSYNEQTITFCSSVGSSPASYSVGDMVQIYVDPANPRNAQINDFSSQWLLSCILGGIGFLFFSIGGLIGFFTFKRQKKIEWLLSNGKKIDADFDSVQLNTNLKINGRSPFRIHCHWLDKSTNTVYNFKSEDIWFNPESYIQGAKLSVIIDPSKPADHYVDLSFLPKEGN